MENKRSGNHDKGQNTLTHWRWNTPAQSSKHARACWMWRTTSGKKHQKKRIRNVPNYDKDTTAYTRKMPTIAQGKHSINNWKRNIQHTPKHHKRSKKIAAIMEEMDRTLHKNKTSAQKEHTHIKPTQYKPPTKEKQTPTTNIPHKDLQVFRNSQRKPVHRSFGRRMVCSVKVLNIPKVCAILCSLAQCSIMLIGLWYTKSLQSLSCWGSLFFVSENIITY